jgi:hypothetical protein
MVSLLLALLVTARPDKAPLKLDGAPDVAVQPLAGAADVVSLCNRLVPAERLRPGGDMIEQGEARSRQETERDRSLGARYRIAVPAGGVAFAPYDGPEQRLEVAEPATFRLEGGSVVLTATEERGLPVQVSALMARKILAARSAGRLGLQLVFDLPDDAICMVDRRGKRFTVPVEPVEWTWADGDTALAWGGVAGDRPAVSTAAGARPAVDVGEPIAGPSEARKAVASRRPDLVACYADELKRDPAVDGVVVVDLGRRIGVAADSTGSATLTACVERVLAPLAGSSVASVPIRFELLAPGAMGTGTAAAGDSQSP